MPSPSLRSPLRRALAFFRLRLFALLVLSLALSLSISLSLLGCVAHIGPPTSPQEPEVSHADPLDIAAEIIDGAADGAAFAALPAIINEDGPACVVTSVFAQALPSAAEVLRLRGTRIPEIEVSLAPCLPLLEPIDPPVDPKDIAVLQASAILTSRSLSRVSRFAARDNCEAAVVIRGVGDYIEQDLSSAVTTILGSPGEDLLIGGFPFDFGPCEAGAEL